jgi:hypothetical protein
MTRYRVVWDKLGDTSRLALLAGVPMWIHNWGYEMVNRKWKVLPTALQFSLIELDWEFMLGRKLF